MHNTSIPELLAPAGGPPQFNAALASGADAIYCGFGNTFNARRGAQSFTSDTFAEACRRAHLAGAQVYVTVNVVIRDDEMPSVLALVRRAWLLGADAFIVQDWGLMHEIRTRWPQIACHVSTQANVHDARGVAWCKELGVERVTLSRELSLAEIARIAQVGVELETFCHGAICICYSGICQMSSCGGDRSANRGACAQPCRLPYELVNTAGKPLADPMRGRPLCPKDFYSFDDLAALVATGVRSLKVEGRLKNPDYLAAVIGTYRAQLDDLARGADVQAETLETRHRSLKRAFNRDFTNAYLMGTSGDELMSYERSNNRGELVGEVRDSRSFGSVKVRRGGKGGGRERLRTAHVAEVDIVLHAPVCRGDLLEVRPISDPTQFLTTSAAEDAEAGDVITCRTSRAMERGSVVRVIRSKQAMDLGERLSNLEVPRKRLVNVRVRARLGKPFVVELIAADGCARAEATGFVVEAARTRSVTREDLVEHVGRMGSSPFEAASFEVELDEGCGMGFSAVHKVRAAACDALEAALLDDYTSRELGPAPSRERIEHDLAQGAAVLAAGGESETAPTPAAVCAVVATPQAAMAAKGAGADRVYAPVDVLAQGSWPEWVIPSLDEVCRELDHERLDPWVRTGAAVAVGNVSELVLARDRFALPEVRTCIPVHNKSCLAALAKAGAAGVWLSPELSLNEITTLAKGAVLPLGVVVRGRVRAMTCEHCVLQVADACVHNCAACKLRKQDLYLRNDAGERFPVRTDRQGRSRVYAARPLDLAPQIPELMAAGVSRFAADCTLMSAEETAGAVRDVRAAVEAALQGMRPAPQKPGHVSGHLFAPIG